MFMRAVLKHFQHEYDPDHILICVEQEDTKSEEAVELKGNIQTETPKSVLEATKKEGSGENNRIEVVAVEDNPKSEEVVFMVEDEPDATK
jgi:hypothetical protein